MVDFHQVVEFLVLRWSFMTDEQKKFLVSKVANAVISLASVLVAYFFGSAM